MQDQQLDFHQEYNRLLHYKLSLLQLLQTLVLCELHLQCVELIYLNLLEIIHILNFLMDLLHLSLIHI